jgi:SAM-dependent methyltransferase
VSDATYIGSELELFANAAIWKAYVRRRIMPFLGADVLEVGAGLGGTTRMLCRGDHCRWVCLEPDPMLARQIEQAICEGELPPCCSQIVGTLDQIEALPAFDTLLYMDVLEHIEDDRGELARAAGMLSPGGHVIALSPAHNGLFTPFDKVIGHYRRYTRATLRALTPPTLKPVRIEYLDSVGLLASLANRLMLRQSMPTASQIAVWDKGMVRVSKLLDPLLGYNLGKSVLGVWKRVPAG